MKKLHRESRLLHCSFRSLLGSFALIFALVVPAAAQAAPAFTVTATTSPASVFRGDEYMTYQITVKNSGDATTSGTTNLNLGLPAGIEFDEGTGTGWTCFLSAKTCSNSSAVGAGGNFPVLTVGVFLQPPQLATTPTATFTAFGGGAAAAGVGQNALNLGPQLEFGLVPGTFVAKAENEAGADYTQAGGHPFRANTAFEFVKKQVRPELGFSTLPYENVRDAVINLPPGFTANPGAMVGGCRVAEVADSSCPERFAIGRAYADLGSTTQNLDQEAVVYKVEAEEGYPAEFAFRVVSLSPVTVVLRPKIRPGDFTIAAFSPTPPQNPALFAVKYFTFCSYGAKVIPPAGVNASKSPGCKLASEPSALAKPFLTNPPRCNGSADVTSINVASYQNTGAFDSEGFPDLGDSDWKTFSTASPLLTGCNSLVFKPSFEGRPSTSVGDSPAGLDFDLRIPQEGLVDPNGLATPHLNDTVVTLPEGMTVNPSAATGLEACSTEQMGLLETDHAPPFEIRFDGKPVACPDGSKIGTVTITSPLIEQTLQGGVYLAEQFDNPFDSLLAMYIVVRDEEIGFSAKLAGKVTPDPVTGQLTAVFRENPQLPFDHLELNTFEGPRASLRTPAICGTKSTVAEFTPWSAPQTGPPVQLTDSFETTSAPGGGRCATSASELPNAPRLTAGTITPKAGAYSPFVLRLARDDGSQELKGLETTLPPGLLGRLAGIPYCPQSGIDRANGRSKPGEGALERDDPSCPAASQVGTVTVGAGAGPSPYHTGGKAYLAGPYKGAPVSLVVITPAVAGPFDLGTVVVRNALNVNPVTAQVSVKSDPFPTILEGIPLDLRSVEVKIDRDLKMLNPTSCNEMAITGIAEGLSSNAPLSQRFQVGECAALGFKPHLRLSLKGGTRRGAHPALTAVLKPRPGDANIASAAVALPHSEFLDQGHIRTVCTRVQFAAHACPAGSVYGEAEATTPLLDYPVRGPVYLRSSSNKLPDLVVALRGPDSQPIEVALAGRVDSIRGGIRNSFEVVPDAPVSKFVLRMRGGKKGLLINSTNICRGVHKATVRMVAQNGKRHDSNVPLRAQCGKKKGKKGKKGKGKGGSKRVALARLPDAW